MHSIVQAFPFSSYKDTLLTHVFKPESAEGHVYVSTEHYYGNLATEEDLLFCRARLYDSPQEMGHYLGSPGSMESTSQRIDAWMQKIHNRNPFAPMVYKSKFNDSFVAISVLEPGSPYEEGVADYAIIVDPDFQRQGAATEITAATFFALAPELAERKYNVNQNSPHVAPLSVIHFKASKGTISHTMAQGNTHQGANSKFYGEGSDDFYLPISDIQALLRGESVKLI